MKKGFSLIEVLIVLTIFSIVAVISTQSVLSTLRSTKKADSETRLRQNIDYAVNIMERHLRNAITISCPSATRVNFTDPDNVSTSFFLNVNGSDRFIASGSANRRLTSSDVSITSLNFSCTAALGHSPPQVDINVTAQDKTAQGLERAETTTQTQVILRTTN